MGSLLDAVKQVESGGRVDAVSPKGAKGPYQFTSATAKDYGLEDPFDEPSARRAAQAKLTDDLEHFGELKLALAAYNSGRGRVDKLLKTTGGDTYEDIRAKLPNETQQYVKKVFRALNSDLYA